MLLWITVVGVLVGGSWAAAVHSLTLRQAIELALQQNPDLALARLEERRAQQEVQIARAPFVPTVVAGSGLAWSSGFPMSIEGATPSVMQARVIADVFNRPQSYRIAAARENQRGAVLETQAKQEQVALRAAMLFLELERAGRLSVAVQRQMESLQKVAELIQVRVSEGRELPLEAKRAALAVARVRQRALTLEHQRRNLELDLALALGLPAEDQVRLVEEQRTWPTMPPSAEAAAEAALRHDRELRALEARLLAKGLEARAERAARLPRLELVAQYGLLARFNNYEEFFRKFERHNGQLGVSFQIPLFVGSTVEARAGRVETEAAALRLQIRSRRERVAAEARRLYQAVAEAEAAREVARLDLEVAREQVSVLLAQLKEGRASLRQLEEARYQENDKWIALYDAEYACEAARLELLAHSGGLTAALR